MHYIHNCVKKQDGDKNGYNINEYNKKRGTKKVNDVVTTSIKGKNKKPL